MSVNIKEIVEKASKLHLLNQLAMSCRSAAKGIDCANGIKTEYSHEEWDSIKQHLNDAGQLYAELTERGVGK